MGFVEEQGSLYCEDCYEKYFAPICGKCDKRVKGVREFDFLHLDGYQFIQSPWNILLFLLYFPDISLSEQNLHNMFVSVDRFSIK